MNLLAYSNRYSVDVVRAWMAMFIVVAFIAAVTIVLIMRMQSGGKS